MGKPLKLEKRTCLPVIYVRGTYYDVGYDIGRTFASLVAELLATHKPLNEDYLPVYETDAGKRVYQAALDRVYCKYSKYVKELQGIADGANVPFHKLFLLHMDDILTNVVSQEGSGGSQYTHGCSTVLANFQDSELLGHNEDALESVLNRVYIVNATIIDDEVKGGRVLEKFSSYCYAGFLPGFAMSYNSHGLVFTINIISAKRLGKGKTPRSFLTRALLACDSLVAVEDVLRDSGSGAADAMSINLTFLNQEGDRLFHNIEVAPPPPKPAPQESTMSVLTLSPGEYTYHCNKFLRLNVEETDGPIVGSSTARHDVANRLPKPDSDKRVRHFLGDKSHPRFTVYRNDYVQTVSTGLFDCVARTWTIYMGNPQTSQPVAILPIDLN